jgi:co-chaperonin GroES (HSP10)
MGFPIIEKIEATKGNVVSKVVFEAEQEEKTKSGIILPMGMKNKKNIRVEGEQKSAYFVVHSVTPEDEREFNIHKGDEVILNQNDIQQIQGENQLYVITKTESVLASIVCKRGTETEEFSLKA